MDAEADSPDVPMLAMILAHKDSETPLKAKTASTTKQAKANADKHAEVAWLKGIVKARPGWMDFFKGTWGVWAIAVHGKELIPCQYLRYLLNQLWIYKVICCILHSHDVKNYWNS